MAFLGLMKKQESEQAINALKQENERALNEMKQEHEQAIKALKQDIFKDIPNFLMATAEGQALSMPNPAVYGNQADLYRTLSWVLQAVSITAKASALTPFEVKRIVSGKEPKDIPNHEFELLLMRPNPLDSRYEFLYGTIAMLMLTGNAYWFLNKANENATPDELWVIPSHMIIPVPDGRMFIRGYLYTAENGREFMLEPWEICHFREFNPYNRFIGLSAIEAIAMIAKGDLGMQEWNTKYFTENNARLPGILTFEQFIEQATWDKIKEDTREASKKRELLMLRGVGNGGVHWMQNAISQKDMEYLKGREFNRDEIWTTLAPGLVSMLSPSATEANARNGSAVFNERSVYPRHVMMAEKITNQILPLYAGRPLIGQFEDIRITDRQMEMDEMKLYSESHTLAEIREKYYGDPPLDDERDDLLPSQIKATSGGIQEPAPVAPQPVNAPQQEVNSAQNTPPENQQQDAQQQAQKAVVDELRKWERKAVKSIGKPVEFVSDIIPDTLARYVSIRLKGCTSQTAVKAVFDAARAEAEPKPKEAEEVLKKLDELLKGK